jgi:hypothetical protein
MSRNLECLPHGQKSFGSIDPELISNPRYQLEDDFYPVGFEGVMLWPGNVCCILNQNGSNKRILVTNVRYLFGTNNKVIEIMCVEICTFGTSFGVPDSGWVIPTFDGSDNPVYAGPFCIYGMESRHVWTGDDIFRFLSSSPHFTRDDQEYEYAQKTVQWKAGYNAFGTFAKQLFESALT